MLGASFWRFPLNTLPAFSLLRMLALFIMFICYSNAECQVKEQVTEPPIPVYFEWANQVQAESLAVRIDQSSSMLNKQISNRFNWMYLALFGMGVVNIFTWRTTSKLRTELLALKQFQLSREPSKAGFFSESDRPGFSEKTKKRSIRKKFVRRGGVGPRKSK